MRAEPGEPARVRVVGAEPGHLRVWPVVTAELWKLLCSCARRTDMGAPPCGGCGGGASPTCERLAERFVPGRSRCAVGCQVPTLLCLPRPSVLADLWLVVFTCFLFKKYVEGVTLEQDLECVPSRGSRYNSGLS